ncbi:MAG: SIMPL domain-containing protein [Xanthomonadales bacterium]|nr:SIMPL domain-containing protein [Xanthomonadales bacterium]
MKNENSLGLLALGIFLAAGIAISGYFIGQTMYNAKVALNTAEAKGLAERRVKADRANWKLRFSVTGKSRDEISALYEKSEEHQQIIIELLKKNGFKQEEIEIGIIDYNYREYRDDNQKLVDQEHQLIGLISVETNKVDLVSKARANVSKLIAQGINISSGEPAYRFTKLNDIKPAMLREATKNSRIAANEFAESAGVSVGGIRNARQGSFYIRDAGEEYGDTGKIEKDVRVVTTITFFLTD